MITLAIVIVLGGAYLLIWRWLFLGMLVLAAGIVLLSAELINPWAKKKPRAKADSRYCPRCGHTMAEDFSSRFCRRCGYSIEIWG